MSLEGAVTCDDVISNMSIKISGTEIFLKLPNTLAPEYSFFSTSKPFEKEVKVKLGSPLCKYF